MSDLAFVAGSVSETTRRRTRRLAQLTQCTLLQASWESRLSARKCRLTKPLQSNAAGGKAMAIAADPNVILVCQQYSTRPRRAPIDSCSGVKKHL